MRSEKNIELSYQIAKELYAEMGVDTDLCLKQLDAIPISLHCWQGDDVVGFEKDASGASGGILSTGNYPGKAGNIGELYQDLDMALKLIPGNSMRVNVHAIYLDSDKPVERNQIQPEHFQSWIDWAKERNLGLDFNPTCFSHPMAADGFTLSHPEASVRQYWIDHVIQCRKISEAFGKQLGKRCFMNIWIPDGFKDIPVDRNAARSRLKDSLDKILAVPVDPA